MKVIPFLCAVLAMCSQASAKVPNFALLDHKGDYHELYYYEKDKDTRLIVVFIQGNACPLVRKRVTELNALKEKYEEKGVRFWMLNANTQDSRDEIAKEAEEFNIEWPILIDDTQLVAKSLDVDRTAEAIVIDVPSWNIIYRGAIDDRLTYESNKDKASKFYLRKALDSGLKGKKIKLAKTNSPGCAITFESASGAGGSQLSYTKTIAPMLLDHCVQCHQQGGIAPFAFSSYKKTRGWSGMIRETVMTRRMPPWQADPHYGEFANDFSLSVKEKRQLVAWIDAGAPRDEGDDPLAAHISTVKKWPLGEPDMIIKPGRREIQSEGVIPYLYVTKDFPSKEGRWLRASHVNPGNKKVLHHVIVSSYSGDSGAGRRRRSGGGVGGYAPGTEPELYPEGYGRYIAGDAKLVFQLHYTPTGKPEVDDTELGLYFYKERPPNYLAGGAVMQFGFRIPPGEREHPNRGSYTIGRDAILFRMLPHMHVRGKSMKYTAKYPDGRTEVLLSVPDFDFNWQRGYILKEPKLLPKGTKIIVTGSWDNSEMNVHNPDPSKAVYYGDQTWEEMFNAFFTIAYVNTGMGDE